MRATEATIWATWGTLAGLWMQAAFGTFWATWSAYGLMWAVVCGFWWPMWLSYRAAEFLLRQ